MPFADGLDFTDPSKSALYAQAAYTTTQGVVLHGTPTVYAYTIPTAAANPAWAAQYLQFVESAQAQAVFTGMNWQTIVPNQANSLSAVPAALRPNLVAWPAGQ